MANDKLFEKVSEYIGRLSALASIDPYQTKSDAMESLIETGMWDKDGNYVGLEKLNE